MVDAIYLRVSTIEKDERQQLPKILNKFGLNKESCLILRDKVSAYKEDKHEKRIEFLELIKKIECNEVKKVYVWDTDRIYRNHEKFKEFFLLCKKNDVDVFSVNQDFINSISNMDNSFKEVIRDIFISILGWMAEEESKKKSERVKLKVDKSNAITKSTYGKKWGAKRKVNIDKVLEFRKEDPSISISEIARRLKVNKGSVSYILNKYLD